LIAKDTSDDELFALMKGMLEPLGDAHTGLLSETNRFGGLRRARFGRPTSRNSPSP